jgi:hypothetical protein
MTSVVVVTVSPPGRQAQMSVRPGSASVRSPKKPATSPSVRAGTRWNALTASPSSMRRPAARSFYPVLAHDRITVDRNLRILAGCYPGCGPSRNLCDL